ncbi:hypothetical protein Agub_g4387 [Astrephomene gubernaculifera]|uniref:Glutaredoxin n=1 Tax=Astrephomene gubernaculifera TaxID=47775 RepID=A0AAD3DK36_9CHLO|nr:hypothetical protein Agub_g4387 [Astrephomene gubernaculifera]
MNVASSRTLMRLGLHRGVHISAVGPAVTRCVRQAYATSRLSGSSADTLKRTPLRVALAAIGASAMGAGLVYGHAAAEVDDADVRTARVAVMSTPACPYCKRAKEALTSAGIAFVDVNIGADEALRQTVRELTGKRTVPQIFVGGRSIGGCDDLLAQLADGSFQQHLAEASAPAAAEAEASGDKIGSGSGFAVPPELLAAIQAAQQRAVQAQDVSAAAAGTSTAASRRLRELAAGMAREPREGGIPREERKIGSRTFRVFSLAQLRQWLAAEAADPDPPATAAQLLAANLITPAAADCTAAAAAATKVAAAAGKGGLAEEGVLLALVSEAPRPAAGEALNTQYWWQGPARPASEVAASLRQLILELYATHLSPDGRSVSYGALRSDPRFAAFVAATAELQQVDLAPLSREELIAFAINLYNALIIHALVALGLTRMTAAQRSTFFSRTAKYNIGGLDFSADDLEQGVLRGNRAGATHLLSLLGLPQLAGGHFSRGDPRARKVVSPIDPRIHFALVCGARSCPPIKLYSAANLEEGLAAAAEAFCATEVQVDRAAREVRLSKIFKWYAIDFGSNKLERLSYLAGFLPECAREDLLALLQEAKSGVGDIRVSYKEYDWNLNGTD